MIFSSSFEAGSLPSIWHSVIVTPVFKKGLSSDVNNYRPISLTCCFCKIMESIVKDQMLDYLLQNKLISKHQHGFLARRSTCKQLLECSLLMIGHCHLMKTFIRHIGRKHRIIQYNTPKKTTI